MTGGGWASVVRQGRILATVSGNRELSWASLAFLGFSVGEIATWVAILVFAYGQGGEAMAGIVGVVQLVPAALVAPFAASFGDRYARNRVLAVGYATQAIAYGATAASLLLTAPAPVTYGLAAAATALTTLSRPVHMALLPSLSRAVEQLTAANVVTGTIESFSLFAGPAVAGLLLGISNPGAIFAAMAALLLGSTLCASRLSRQPKPILRAVHARPSGLGDELLGGVNALRAEPQVRVVFGLLGAQQVVLGALDLLFITIAFRLLGTGSAGAGFLSAAYGVGAIVGGVVATLIVGHRLAPPLLAGAGLWGIALGTVGLAPAVRTAPALLGLGWGGADIDQCLWPHPPPSHHPGSPPQPRLWCPGGPGPDGISGRHAPRACARGTADPQGAIIVVGLFLPLVGLAVGRRLVALDARAIMPLEQIQLPQAT